MTMVLMKFIKKKKNTTSNISNFNLKSKFWNAQSKLIIDILNSTFQKHKN